MDWTGFRTWVDRLGQSFATYPRSLFCPFQGDSAEPEGFLCATWRTNRGSHHPTLARCLTWGQTPLMQRASSFPLQERCGADRKARSASDAVRIRAAQHRTSQRNPSGRLPLKGSIQRGFGLLDYQLEVAADLRIRSWFPEQVPLSEITVGFSQDACLLLGFDTFGDDVATEVVRHADE